MKFRSIIYVTSLIVLCALSNPALAAADRRSYVSGEFAFDLQGVKCGFIQKMEGGDVSAEKVTDAQVGGLVGLTPKEIASLMHQASVTGTVLIFPDGKPLFGGNKKALAKYGVLPSIFILIPPKYCDQGTKVDPAKLKPPFFADPDGITCDILKGDHPEGSLVLLDPDQGVTWRGPLPIPLDKWNGDGK